MNKKKTSLLFLTSILLGLPVFGQSGADEIKLAVSVLKGTDNVMSKQEALLLLEKSQELDRDGYILNVLGIAYLHGIGTMADTTKAISLFEESGEADYANAYHNLGMLYKYADDSKQNFEKAFSAFKKGAEKQSVSNYYNCGFMKYKGLGCEQNYEEAIDYFLKAAEKKHADASYMLGLCYRNGYGVPTDTAIANTYLKQAATLGCPGAMEELMKESPENNHNYLSGELTSDTDIPGYMPVIEPFIPNQKQEVSGLYKGYLVAYDWSGSTIIYEKKLTVSMNVSGDKVSGLWIQDNDSIMLSASISNTGTISFDSTELDLYDRYSWNFRARYRFEKMDISYINGQIAGQLRLYSLDEQEPDRPMYVCLEKESESKPKENINNSTLYAYSAPSSGQVILKFELAQTTEDVKVSIFDRNGFNCNTYKFGVLEAGKQELTLSANLEKGIYSICVSAGSQQLKTIIVK